MRYLLTVLSVVVFLAACGNDTEENLQKENATLTISAAASMTDVMEELKNVYENEENAELTLNFGGSGKLAQQIQQGAPADVFISANQDWMNRLENDDLILPATRKEITGNSIVLIANKDSTLDYDSIDTVKPNDVEQIAIGNPESVPAGRYAQQTLKSLQLWDKLKDEMVLAKDVRQVLTYVETGNTDIGFVYKSDALISDKIQVLTEADAATHDAIIYPTAVIADTKHKKKAKAFVEFLQTDEAQTIFKKYGFEITKAQASLQAKNATSCTSKPDVA
ncbi:molybdate ABC transporter substrate-binding protein [Lentibacillus cibarius]|uniref:Molybdate ABC transporter substrate-binding protein n=1 Tax=Lentibacillus cibarius TaxID=2583219 RepID=A0A5S3QIU2_9BACI|nr:molybdate ABC transporter substrate-binding protein [Lentibacillus cibarius]TMN21141.1 molybdate ABC transporter substrate-binding protein [Lentibacillus cibarius]